MAISPNDDFTAGQVLTATECNQFPRGVMAYAQSTADYTLTTSDVIATGMTLQQSQTVTTESPTMNHKFKHRRQFRHW